MRPGRTRPPSRPYFLFTGHLFFIIIYLFEITIHLCDTRKINRQLFIFEKNRRRTKLILYRKPSSIWTVNFLERSKSFELFMEKTIFASSFQSMLFLIKYVRCNTNDHPLG